jgi:sortase B
MKKRTKRLACAAAYTADRLLSGIIALLLTLALLYSGYALWDTWSIFHEAEVDSELLKYKPSGAGGSEAGLTFSDLQMINKDVCAWLTVDDTNIDYPVVQGETNIDYINRDVYGEFSLSGSVFLDYRNANDFSDYYSLIYAHHMDGKVMFGEIPEFLEEEYFQSHTGGTLSTADRTFKIEWFACIRTDAYDMLVFRPTDCKTDEAKEELLSYLKENAEQYRELTVSRPEQLVALSTCSDVTTNGRVILFGRMVEI